MLELLGETPVAAMSMAFPQEGVKYTPSQTDAIMAHKFTEVTNACKSIEFYLVHAPPQQPDTVVALSS